MTPHDGAVGSHVQIVDYQRLAWAVHVLTDELHSQQISSLKIRSGEHLAAILTTAFLGLPPVELDWNGGPDIMFGCAANLDSSTSSESAPRGIAFEIKSLPGGFRKYEAAIDRSLRLGKEPEALTYGATVTSINDVLQGPGLVALTRASEQLDRKVGNRHSRNAFLIAHQFDYPIVEMLEMPLIAHLISRPRWELSLDTVWVLLAPSCLVVWSQKLERWTNLLWGSTEPNDPTPDPNSRLEVLQQIDLDFQARAGRDEPSPYVFEWSAPEK